MRKNENSGFYLINYAKISVIMTYFIASVPRQELATLGDLRSQSRPYGNFLH